MMNPTIEKVLGTLMWLPSYGWQRLVRSAHRDGPVHLLIAVADHFEPSHLPGFHPPFAPIEEQERRLEQWCREYPRVADNWRDADGFPFRHTYFYPAEQYHPALLERLAAHCHAGWGEVEIHLHHGVETPDTAENTRRTIEEFRDRLVAHGCLCRWDGSGPSRYAFAHGNWALANSSNNRFCGVDEEMQILADTGCYADFTLPSAPDPSQISKINSLYECSLPLNRRAPHRRGKPLRRGTAPSIFPLIMQGPLGLNFTGRLAGVLVPKIENGALMASLPPSIDRLRLWRKAAITVVGQPSWIFIKLHCHGMDPRDTPMMLGEQRRTFLKQLAETASSDSRLRLHFVTAREMVNIALAACDGREGEPGQYRDYRLRLIQSVPMRVAPHSGASEMHTALPS
jgi:hypothetical protein